MVKYIKCAQQPQVHHIRYNVFKLLNWNIRNVFVSTDLALHRNLSLAEIHWKDSLCFLRGQGKNNVQSRLCFCSTGNKFLKLSHLNPLHREGFS